MTTEQQAREALKRLFYAAGMVPASVDMKIVDDFITQSAEDKAKLELYSSLASKYEELRKIIDDGSETYTHEDALWKAKENQRIADAVRGAAGNATRVQYQVGNLLINGQKVISIPASVLEGE